MKNNEEAIEEVKNELMNLKNSLKEAFLESGGVISDKAKHLMKETFEKFEEKFDTIKDKTRKISRSADEVVRDHPWQTAATALAVGLVVGLLISRRHD